MKLVKSKQIKDNTITQQNLKISYNSIINDTDITNKQFVDEFINKKVATVNFSQLNQDMTALSTSSSTLACDKYIIEYPISEVMVRVNGIEVSLGGTGSTYDCYFSGDNGATVSDPPQKGDYLYWTNRRYELESDDELDFEYLVNYEYIYAIAGSAYTFNQKFDNTVIKFNGNSGTTSTLTISSNTYVFGNVAGQFVFDIGGADEHIFSEVGDSYVIKIDNNLYTIIWDGYGSLIFSVEKQKLYNLVFDISLPEGDTSYTLPLLDGYNYNFKVNWNNEVSRIVRSYNDTNATYTFATAGIKTISLIGKCEAFNTFDLTDYKIIGISEFNEDMGFLNLSFGNCYGLSSLTFSSLPTLTMTTSVLNLFNGCSMLTEIPSTLFSNNSGITDFSYCFANTSIITIPDILFSGNTEALTFNNCFENCSTIEAIPSNLFTYNVNVTNFNYCFSYCSTILEIPSTLFETNINVTNFDYCFAGCISVPTISETLFINNTNVTSFMGTFANDRLTTIPVDIFKYNTGITNMSYCFGGNSLLTNIPELLFRQNLNIETVSYCFYGCAITAITNNLFDYNVNITDFSYCFANTQALTYIPTDIFINNINALSFGGCFSNCISLSNIPINLFRYNTNVTDLSFSFYGCAASTLPTDIFRYNTAVIDFSDCFYNCPNLRSLPENLFYYNSNVISYSGVFSNCSHITLPSVIFNTSNLSIVEDFSYFMECSSAGNSFTGTIQDIWTYAPEANNINCFVNQTALTNYASIPSDWK